MPVKQSKRVENVFLSYAKKDSQAATALSAALEAAGVKTFTFRNILPGENFASAIGRWLDKSDAMVLLLSPAWMESEYTQSELEYALVNERFKDRLLPVMLKDTSDYPWILQTLSQIRFTDAPATSREILQALGRPAGKEHGQEKRRVS